MYIKKFEIVEFIVFFAVIVKQNNKIIELCIHVAKNMYSVGFN